MSIQLVILVVFMVALLAISWYSTKLMHKSTNQLVGYFLAGRGIPWIIVVALLFGTAIGGTSTVGVAEQAYTNGLSAGWYNGAWGIGAIIAGLFFVRHTRKWRKTTVPEIMGEMFGSSARYISVIAMIVFMLVILSLQFVAGGSILAALLPQYFPNMTSGMILSAVVFVLITLIGGYWASGLSNFICCIVIILGVIVSVVFAIPHFGGWSSIVEALPKDLPRRVPGRWLSLTGGIGAGAIFGYIASFVVQGVGAQSVAQVAFAAKGGKTARLGFIVAAILIFPFGFVCAIFGIIGAARFPGLERAAMALPMVVSQIPAGIGGVLLAALWAADISTAIGILMAVSTMLVNDVIKKFLKIEVKHDLVLSRICVFLAAILGLLMAMTIVGMVATITAAMGITSTFMILFTANIYFPKLLKKVMGFWMTLISLIVFIFWQYTPALAWLKPVLAGQVSFLLIILNIIMFILFAAFAKVPATLMVEHPEDDG
jgi:SSS family solute:Na+ symporter